MTNFAKTKTILIYIGIIIGSIIFGSQLFGKTPTIETTEWLEGDIPATYALELHHSTANPDNFERISNSQNVYGQYALVKQLDETSYEAVRDPLGIGKMFYTQADNGTIHFAERFIARPLSRFG